MRLCLTSEAAPGATLPELAQACQRRGLQALELARDLSTPGPATSSPAGEEAPVDPPVEICGVYREHWAPAQLPALAEGAARLGGPLVLAIDRSDCPQLDAAAGACARTGATLLLAHGSDPELVVQLAEQVDELPGNTGLAWNVRPNQDESPNIEETLARTGSLLRYLRLHGGGPESERQTGRGVGSLMGRLTLAGYDGPLVLTPSDPRFHYIWRAWLGRAGGWGCGSKRSDSSLVDLGRDAL